MLHQVFVAASASWLSGLAEGLLVVAHLITAFAIGAHQQKEIDYPVAMLQVR